MNDFAPNIQDEPLTSGSSKEIRLFLWSDGLRRSVLAREGDKLMFVLKRAGLPLPAICGGKGACGTCKVAFELAWASKLPNPEKRELRLLTYLQSHQGERLSCQIQLTSQNDGLEIFACD